MKPPRIVDLSRDFHQQETLRRRAMAARAVDCEARASRLATAAGIVAGLAVVIAAAFLLAAFIGPPPAPEPPALSIDPPPAIMPAHKPKQRKR